MSQTMIQFEALARSLNRLHRTLRPRDIAQRPYGVEDLEMAIRLRKLPVEKRKQAVRALIAVLDNLGIGPGDDGAGEP